MAVAGLLVVAAPLAAQAPTKIGYIDTRRVIQEAPGAQEARATLEREMQGWQQQLQAMDDSLRTMMTDYQQRSLVMSADAKQRASRRSCRSSRASSSARRSCSSRRAGGSRS
jgi:outer membrane protein